MSNGLEFASQVAARVQRPPTAVLDVDGWGRTDQYEPIIIRSCCAHRRVRVVTRPKLESSLQKLMIESLHLLLISMS